MSTFKEDLEKVGTDKAKKEHEHGRQERAKDTKKILGAEQAEAKRLADGDVNYALFNLGNYTLDFRTCATALDSNRLVYKGLYPYITKMAKEIKVLRKLVRDGIDAGYDTKDQGKERSYILHLTESDYQRFLTLEQTWEDPQVMAVEKMTLIKEAALKRSKSNIYTPEKKIKLIK